MCYGTFKVKNFLIIIFLIFFQKLAFAFDLNEFKSTCTDLGFKKGTEKHGSCVMTLYKNSNKSKKNSSSNRKNLDVNEANLNEHKKFLQEQNNLLLRQQELKQKEEILRELKKERSLRYLGIANKGLQMIGPKSGSSSSSSSSSKIYNFGCRTYGINTLCSGN